MNKFDYYIFIDYSGNLLGYGIIETDKIPEILPLITRFRHYRDSKKRKLYLKNVKNTIKKDKIKTFFYKIKIREIRLTPEIYADIAGFIKNHENCLIFISVDDTQYKNFKKFVEILDGDNILVRKESDLKKGSKEYMLSLVVDNLLNIERGKNA